MYTKVQKFITLLDVLTEQEEMTEHFRSRWILQAYVFVFNNGWASGGPKHKFVPLTLDCQHLLVTPGTIPLSISPGIPQPDHEELFCVKRECQTFSKVQLPNCSHWVGMTSDKTCLWLHLIGSSRGRLQHQKWQKRELVSLRTFDIYTFKGQDREG